jgi:hypothetical protein
MSLTDLVDIVSRSGTPKATKIKEIKGRDSYSPATDFYKRFRDGVVRIHSSGGDKTELKGILAQTDSKKLNHYPDLVNGYRKWWGKKALQWFEPPSEIWHRHGVSVRVNPELGLVISGTPHVIKLYLKGDKLSRTRISIISHLMTTALASKLVDGTVLSVLDVRHSKLHPADLSHPLLAATLDAELAYVATLWRQL